MDWQVGDPGFPDQVPMLKMEEAHQQEQRHEVHEQEAEQGGSEEVVVVAVRGQAGGCSVRAIGRGQRVCGHDLPACSLTNTNRNTLPNESTTKMPQFDVG
jgi:hypothetical protein